MVQVEDGEISIHCEELWLQPTTELGRDLWWRLGFLSRVGNGRFWPHLCRLARCTKWVASS